MDKAFKVSAIIFGVSISILILIIWTTIEMPIEWLEDPVNQANYPVMIALVKVLNAISGIDLLTTLLSLFSTVITGIIKIAKSD